MAKQTQLDKFKKAARDLGADDSEKRFNERLGKFAKQSPPDAPKRRPKANASLKGVFRIVGVRHSPFRKQRWQHLGDSFHGLGECF